MVFVLRRNGGKYLLKAYARKGYTTNSIKNTKKMSEFNAKLKLSSLQNSDGWKIEGVNK